MEPSVITHEICDIRFPKSRHLILPAIPEDRWCDFRREYESGSTIKSIAGKHFCDPRTVRLFLQLNRNSSEIGRQRAPTILAPWLSDIQGLYRYYSSEGMGICQISSKITCLLKQRGYTGTERTVRNYLRKQLQIVEDEHSGSPTKNPDESP